MESFNYVNEADRKWDNQILSSVAQIHEYRGRHEIYLYHKPAEAMRLKETVRIHNQSFCNTEEEKKTVSEMYRLINGYDQMEPLQASLLLNLYRMISHNDQASNADETMKPIYEGYMKAERASSADPLLIIPMVVMDCIHLNRSDYKKMDIGILIAELLLHRNGYHISDYISLKKIISEKKDALESAVILSEDINDVEPFIKYFLQVIEMAYRIFEQRVDLYNVKPAAYDIVKKAVNLCDGEFTKVEVLEMCPAIRHSSVEEMLRRLTKEGHLVRIGKGRSTRYLRK